MKNAALVGAMLFVVANGPGRFSLDSAATSPRAAEAPESPAAS